MFKSKLFDDPAQEAEFYKWQKLEHGIDNIHHEDKRRIVGYGPEDTFGFFDLQARYFEWRSGDYLAIPADQKPKELLAMNWATAGLLLHAMVHTNKNPSAEETAFMEQTKTLWGAFRKENKESINMQYDAACDIFFSHVSDPPSRELIVDPFHFSTIRFPLELTYLFHTNREQCSSLEHAQQFDRAYLVLFKHRNGPDLSFADHPYSAVLDGTLAAPLPLPGVDIELTATVVVTVSEPVIEEEPDAPVEAEPVTAEDLQEEVEAPAPPVKEYVLKPVQQPAAQPVTPDMSVDEALTAFVFDTKEDLNLTELTRQYKKLAIRDGLSPEMLVEIDVAYQVLKSHLETPKEITEARAREIFEYGQDEIPKLKDLSRRYKKFIQKGLPDEVQEEIDAAYHVLLKIAA